MQNDSEYSERFNQILSILIFSFSFLFLACIAIVILILIGYGIYQIKVIDELWAFSVPALLFPIFLIVICFLSCHIARYAGYTIENKNG